MGRYTREMKELLETPELEDFIEFGDWADLHKWSENFRTFPEALLDYMEEQKLITQKDPKQAQAWITHRFWEKQMGPNPRDLFKKETGIQRETALKLCLAFDLKPEDAEYFLCHIALQHPFYAKSPLDIIYQKAMELRLPWVTVNGLLEAYIGKNKRTDSKNNCAKNSCVKNSHNTEKTYVCSSAEHYPSMLEAEDRSTQEMQQEADQIDSLEELEEYLQNNRNSFLQTRKTARQDLKELWKQVKQTAAFEIQHDALAEHEPDLDLFHGDSQDIWHVLLRIYGLDYEENKGMKNRSISHLFENSQLPAALYRAFPDRNKINKLLADQSLEEESMRKLLILLFFYRFWKKLEPGIGLPVAQEYPERMKVEQLNERFVSDLTDHLEQDGFAPLYPGHPFDWVILYCCNLMDDNLSPLDYFQDMIRKLHQKNQQENELCTMTA